MLFIIIFILLFILYQDVKLTAFAITGRLDEYYASHKSPYESYKELCYSYTKSFVNKVYAGIGFVVTVILTLCIVFLLTLV